MKLLMKFNLLLVVVFALGLVSTYFEARGFLEKQARNEVLREAGLMATSATATRIYTEEMVTPYLAKSGEQEGVFLPQTIPFFATTTIFGKIQQEYPDYTYKEAALNPTNLRDRATDWEADLIQHFRDSPKDTELVRTRDSANGPSLYLAHPVRVEKGCLQCHSDRLPLRRRCWRTTATEMDLAGMWARWSERRSCPCRHRCRLRSRIAGWLS